MTVLKIGSLEYDFRCRQATVKLADERAQPGSAPRATVTLRLDHFQGPANQFPAFLKSQALAVVREAAALLEQQ